MAHGYPDFEGNKQGLYLAAAWAAKEAKSVTFGFDHTIIVDGAFTSWAHVVAAGKTLYIVSLAFGAHGVADDDKEVPQHVVVFLSSPAINNYITGLGGEGGGGLSFDTPIIIASGVTVWVVLENFSGHQCQVMAKAHGYEI